MKERHREILAQEWEKQHPAIPNAAPGARVVHSGVLADHIKSIRDGTHGPEVEVTLSAMQRAADEAKRTPRSSQKPKAAKRKSKKPKTPRPATRPAKAKRKAKRKARRR